MKKRLLAIICCMALSINGAVSVKSPDDIPDWWPHPTEIVFELPNNQEILAALAELLNPCSIDSQPKPSASSKEEEEILPITPEQRILRPSKSGAYLAAEIFRKNRAPDRRPCQKCSKTFDNKHDLIRHQLTHTGVKDFHCEVCGTVFSQEASLWRHKKNPSKKCSERLKIKSF